MGEIHFLLRDIHQVGAKSREWLIHPEYCAALRRHQIVLAGISHATSGFRFSRTRPEMWQLLVCFRGQGRVWIEGGWEKCTAGMAYLTPPTAFHAYEAGRRWDIGWIIYEPQAALSVIDAPTLIETDPRPLEHILRGLDHEISTTRERSVLEHWSQLLHHHATRIIVPDHSSRLWRLWQAVQADLALDWNLQKMARLAGLGPENLRRICLKETGRSPMQQVTHLRMAYAASLLTTGLKIEEVGHMVGYSNAFAFSTAFKRLMKRPPSRFRD
jgi:AraC-like DNA-binding protein